MKDHTVIGGEILKDITMINNLDVGAKYHHEKFDGTGYPEGLKGEEIPEIARIIGVADAYDAMTSNRVYRQHLPQERVVGELAKGSGTQFDPKACRAMLKLIAEDRLPRLDVDNESIEVKQSTKILTRVIDRAEETAHEDLRYDELTGTFGRETGIRVIQNEISEFGQGMVYVFDLDNFRHVNEKEGFGVGDKYLSTVASRIRLLRDRISVSRFGPDVFVAYLPEVTKADIAEKIAEDFVADIRKLAEEPAFSMLSVSVGITPVFTEKDRVMVLYESANKALFVAKQNGEGSWFCNRPSVDDEDEASAANSADLKKLVAALKHEEVESPEGFSGEEFTRVSGKVDYLLEQTTRAMTVALFTLRLTEDKKMSPEDRNKLTSILENAIHTAVRGGDMMFRFSALQFGVVFVGMEKDVIRQVVNRIMASFYRANTTRGVEVHYDSSDLRSEAASERG